MKKGIFVFISLLFFMLFIRVDAEILYDDPANISACKPLGFQPQPYEINLIKGTSDSSKIEEFIQLADEFCTSYFDTGDVSCKATLSNASQELYLYEYFYGENYKLCKYEAYIGSEMFYQLVINEGSYEILLNEEINLLDYCQNEEKSFNFECEFYVSPNQIQLEYDIDEAEYFAYTLLYGYLYNIGNNGDVYNFVTESTSPISLEYIQSSISCSDETEGELSYTIENNNYIVEDNYIEVGEYTFEIYSYDSYGNLTIQRCMVNVIDKTAPTITGIDATSSYIYQWLDSNLLDRFEAEDASGILSMEITYNEYAQNNGIPGIYRVICTATDNYGNFSTCEIKLEIIDNIMPTITRPSKILISTQTKYTIEDIKALIYVNDAIDGDILDFEVVDHDLYLENQTKYGTYNFTINASDKSGNSNTSTFIMEVEDLDYPVIDISSEYTILLPSGQKLTEEEIAKILIKLGQITTDDYKLSSNYFNEQNPNGQYELTVEVDGKLYKNYINVSSDSLDTIPPTIDSIVAPSSNNILIIIIISGVALLFIFGFGIVIYKKKH